MNIVQIAQITGIVSFLILITIKLYIVSDSKRFIRSGKTAMAWTLIYFYFLIVLRILAFFNVGTLEQLRIVSGFSTLIPLLMVLFELLKKRKVV